VVGTLTPELEPNTMRRITLTTPPEAQVRERIHARERAIRDGDIADIPAHQALSATSTPTPRALP
jgi:hypothetical protein